ncbi:hypothetical protein CTAYLR_007214 [Chrysophaeum taylorii]|uniref:Agmatinase n=1 Tax=Chrysophaeum taylorii TaxID=2483200 RepID=A0AAD7UAK1_9STRA|nr:hypothetical protein CTAYLR_007214 [Chrysophaeum taylorii]
MRRGLARLGGGAYGAQPEALATVNAGPRYASGPATFFRCEYTPPQGAACDVGIVGVPFDGGVTSRPGSRHGPRGVREQSAEHIRAFAQDGFCAHTTAVVRDVGDVVVTSPFELVGAHAEIQQAFAALCPRMAPLAVGGDHSITLPILRALSAHHGEPLSLVHIDAHADTGDDYLGSRFHHGAPFRRAAEEGCIDPRRTIQIGIRGTLGDPDAWAFSYDSGMRVVGVDEFDAFWARDPSLAGLAREVGRVVGTGKTYISFDIDVLDPAYAPGTGTPEAGGLSTRQALCLLRAIDSLDLPGVIGADLVEVAPPWCSGYITALSGATILYDLLRILSRSRAAASSSSSSSLSSSSSSSSSSS